MGTDIQITVRGGREEDGIHVYKPEEVVQGSIQVTPDADLQCKHLYVRLRWHTEGRGDKDEGVAAEADVFQGNLKTGVPVYHTFHLRLPDSPWSYAGYYVNIVWEVEVALDVPWARDPKGQLPVILTAETR